MAIPLAEPFGHSTWDRGEGLFAEAPRDGGFYLCDCAGSVSDPRTPALCLDTCGAALQTFSGITRLSRHQLSWSSGLIPPIKGALH